MYVMAIRGPTTRTATNHLRMCFSVTAVTFLLLFPGFYSTMTVTTLQSFRGCARPVLEPPYIQRHHSVCTYSRTRHLTARLPGCRPGVSPIYHYPQALQCDCTYCSSNHTECETF
ncbi:glycoprotein hormone beta-5-like isoform X2 [Megalobrama amblycephala]|uniref:glycoprotein hormone beta-5-like isoform X2 n=1 Tax=Megalobrama amblycephala TaxID=75352 RepID=UPI002013FD43|nr:glycoprotein hormone beta-5-like isoform X2 [Megalobrama amblycephala]